MGNIDILQGEDAVEAACQTTSLMLLGEAVLATTLGIPYFQAVWIGRMPNLAVYESYLRQAILNVQGVIGIESLTIGVTEGVLSYTATIQNVFGEAFVLSQDIPSP